MGTFFRFGYQIYRFLFARRFFYKWNRWVLHCALKGLGINLGQSISGEKACLKKLLCSLYKPVLIDVGANSGEWSRMALQVNPSSQIFAFEPGSLPFEKLKSLPKITAFNFACGAVEETRPLYDREDQMPSTHASLDSTVITELHQQSATEKMVQVIPLDQFFKTHKIDHVDFLKIDVEGFEYEVLQGASNAIATGKIHAIQFEFNQMNVMRKRFMHDFLKLLPNYTFYRLLPKGRIPLRSYDPTYHELFGFQNILAIHQ